MQNLHLHTFLLKFLLDCSEQKIMNCAKIIGIAPYSVSRLKARYRQFDAHAGIVLACNVAGRGKYAAWAVAAEKKLYIFNLTFIYHIQEIIF